MKHWYVIFLLFVGSIGFSQSKGDFIEAMPLDSCVLFDGGASLINGTCYIIKFTGDEQTFLNELARFHIQDESKSSRTQEELFIPSTTKPYWVYGEYSVLARLYPSDNHVRIEVEFKAYSNPANYRMYGAEKAYQEIINSILAK